MVGSESKINSLLSNYSQRISWSHQVWNAPVVEETMVMWRFLSTPRFHIDKHSCSLPHSHQVSWIFEHTDGQRDNIAVYHPTYGESFPNQSFRGRVVFLQKSLENPSIRISNLKMSDAGRYTCEYATYPTGNEQGTTTLIMLGELKGEELIVILLSLQFCFQGNVFFRNSI